MTVEVRWSEVCTADVRSLPWRTAARVCAAVLTFARTGNGPVEQVSGGPPSLFCLRVQGAVALFRVEAGENAIFVHRIYASR